MKQLISKLLLAVFVFPALTQFKDQTLAQSKATSNAEARASASAEPKTAANTEPSTEVRIKRVEQGLLPVNLEVFNDDDAQTGHYDRQTQRSRRGLSKV